MADRKFFYENVPGLGNVVVTRKALRAMDERNIDHALFERVLLNPRKPDVPDGLSTVWREHNGLRIVIVTEPVPDRGAKVVTTVFRVQAQAQARPRR